MIEIRDQLIRGVLQFDEINQQPDVVQFPASSIDLDLIVVAVEVLALPFITAQLVRAGKVALDHYFEFSRHD